MAIIPHPAAGRRGLAAAGEHKEADAGDCEGVEQFHLVEVIGFGKLSWFAGIKKRQFAEKKNYYLSLSPGT